MGMTIDEAKMQLSMQKFYVLGKDYEAVQVAIDIMRKYQKIKHIINDVPYLDKDEYKIASIKEIIDGNDD